MVAATVVATMAAWLLAAAAAAAAAVVATDGVEAATVAPAVADFRFVVADFSLCSSIG